MSLAQERICWAFVSSFFHSFWFLAFQIHHKIITNWALLAGLSRSLTKKKILDKELAWMSFWSMMCHKPTRDQDSLLIGHWRREWHSVSMSWPQNTHSPVQVIPRDWRLMRVGSTFLQARQANDFTFGGTLRFYNMHRFPSTFRW